MKIKKEKEKKKAECRMQNYNAECRIRNAECRIIMQNADYNADCRVCVSRLFDHELIPKKKRCRIKKKKTFKSLGGFLVFAVSSYLGAN